MYTIHDGNIILLLLKNVPDTEIHADDDPFIMKEKWK